MLNNEGEVGPSDKRHSRFRRLSLERFTLDPSDTLAFLVTYGRYESSAKALGWVRAYAKDAEPAVCLSKVAEVTEDGFQKLVNAEPSLKEAVRYIYENPPLKQVWDGHQMQWQEVSRNEKGQLLMLLNLAQARNNLFHGGKGWNGADCLERDRLVVTHGLTILCAVIDANTDLKEKFEAFW